MKVTVIFEVFWQFKTAPWYKVSKCKKVINNRTQKIIKLTTSGGSMGYNIAGKFINIKTANSHLEPIKQNAKT